MGGADRHLRAAVRTPEFHGELLNREASADPPAVVVFARLDDLAGDEPDRAGQLPRRAVDLLAACGVRLVLVSASRAAYVRRLQDQLNVAEPFVCESGGAVYVPSALFESADAPDAADANWEVFRFSPPDRAAAVHLVRDLFLAHGSADVLTIGIGSDLDDYGVLAAVDVPVVVRDPLKEQVDLLRYVPGAYLTNATGVDGWCEALIGP